MPRDVLREAVLNAIVHKDYSTGNPIHIKIYDDKLIIYNNCQLPVNVSSESLLKSIGSRPHNPLIAGTFFRSGQIEAWGRGIEKMKIGCIADNLPEPEFCVRPTDFSICFRIHNNNNKAIGDIFKTVIPIIKTSEKQAKNKRIKQANNTSEKKQLILVHLKEHSQATVADFVDVFKLSEARIRVILHEMTKEGLIEKVGKTKSVHYVLKQI